ncbi:ATP-dependent zinc metalloprotease FtsH [Telluria mixta]|uniref:ATP-dependent zinc metalloprotease FtsH n=1 Tax=Telluria mixta TaxID=34071 RepID=A0ABT2CB22_9BURK|nr:ATP-dependent zinc metalloprotease FtsH [Telluria mixta]MCS0633859.1 ATP-dependent zinc metalloprotease FtsH [Telluria mixta]WEM99373.1 ATP-dependent zinc metalloprotease FtsH [Telluria mixta]
MLWYWLFAIVLFMLFQSVTDVITSSPLAYSEFKELLHGGKVNEVTLAETSVSGTLKSGGLDAILPRNRAESVKCNADGLCPFNAVRVADPDLVKELDAAHVRYFGQQHSEWLSTLLSWALPLLLLFWMWGVMAKRGGVAAGLFDVGKSRARVYMQSKTGVSFNDVAGIDEARDELMEIVEFLKNPQRYRRLGGRIPKGVLIVGPPGTGKTLLARAVAGEAGVPFFSISGSEFVEMFVGVGAARVRDMFVQAQKVAPCIIFIDELDALGRARGVAGVVGGYNEQEQTLNQLLVEMDGFDTNKGVIILGATNRPEILDPALLRPGRFDRHVALDRPDLKGRQKILQVHAREVRLAPDVDLAAVAAKTPGLAGADLANLINEAALLAARRGKERVERSDLEEAVDRVIAGMEKRSRLINPMEKETVAFHEAGHALTAEFRAHADRVAKVSIIPRGIAALGYTQQLPAEDRYLLKKSELLDRMDVMLGGRVAEELVFGDLSTGAQNDLQMATDLARHMVAQYGMSERLGLATFEQPAAAPYAPVQPPNTAYSERTARLIDAEIARLLDEAHQRVRVTLREQRPLLDALARQLLDHETVERDALQALVRAHAVRPVVAPSAPPTAEPVADKQSGR